MRLLVGWRTRSNRSNLSSEKKCDVSCVWKMKTRWISGRERLMKIPFEKNWKFCENLMSLWCFEIRVVRWYRAVDGDGVDFRVNRAWDLLSCARARSMNLEFVRIFPKTKNLRKCYICSISLKNGRNEKESVNLFRSFRVSVKVGFACRKKINHRRWMVLVGRSGSRIEIAYDFCWLFSFVQKTYSYT